ncbi:MAG: hypothetical protein H7175_16515 [Burkholderiales bacterium]|nr:hypothetical protein [Anaerolineae bacterium]
MPSQQWARNFTITAGDLEYLKGILLEREVPLNSEQLARALIQEHLEQEAKLREERFRNVQFYDPANTYQIGQKVMFPALEYATATIVGVRSGNNPDYGEFNVVTVNFDDGAAHGQPSRDFAADLSVPHKLSDENTNAANPLLIGDGLTADEIMSAAREDIIATLEESLLGDESIILVAGTWFPRDLIVEVNIGYRNLAEAVLDMNEGGAISTQEILNEIGGLGDVPMELQIFSMNYALSQDSRFDEVGPKGEVLWYLARLEPQEVQKTPWPLRYTAIEYDRALLSSEMLALEIEIADEQSPAERETPESVGDETQVTLAYPHRRAGTLPLNSKTRHIFPTARRTPRVSLTLVDGQDGEEYSGWVVRKEKYVYGLDQFYRKHRLPVGAYVLLEKSDDPGKIIVDFEAYRPRTEYIKLVVPHNGQLSFENHRRQIGAAYDDLMILGVDDIPAVDALHESAQTGQPKTLVSILRALIPELGKLSPQGTVHAKTLYNAVNVLRRCPPGAVFATLVANPDFQNVGGHYWKLKDAAS